MEIDRVKLSKEVNICGMHYWVGLEGVLIGDEDPVEALKILDGKIEVFCNPVIQTIPTQRKYNEVFEELPSIDINQQ